MSSLKDAAATSLLRRYCQTCAQNKNAMSVTAPVSHVEMWPYVAVSPGPRIDGRADAVSIT